MTVRVGEAEEKARNQGGPDFAGHRTQVTKDDLAEDDFFHNWGTHDNG